jgi:hypothetical protein
MPESMNVVLRGFMRRRSWIPDQVRDDAFEGPPDFREPYRLRKVFQREPSAAENGTIATLFSLNDHER